MPHRTTHTVWLQNADLEQRLESALSLCNELRDELGRTQDEQRSALAVHESLKVCVRVCVCVRARMYPGRAAHRAGST